MLSPGAIHIDGRINRYIASLYAHRILAGSGIASILSRLNRGLNAEVSHLEQSILPLRLAGTLHPVIVRIIGKPSFLPRRCFVTSFKRSTTGTRGPPALFTLTALVRANFNQVVPILLEATIKDHDGADIGSEIFSDGRKAVLERRGLTARGERHCIVCPHYRFEDLLDCWQIQGKCVSARGGLRPAVEYPVHA